MSIDKAISVLTTKTVLSDSENDFFEIYDQSEPLIEEQNKKLEKQSIFDYVNSKIVFPDNEQVMFMMEGEIDTSEPIPFREYTNITEMVVGSNINTYEFITYFDIDHNTTYTHADLSALQIWINQSITTEPFWIIFNVKSYVAGRENEKSFCFFKFTSGI